MAGAKKNPNAPSANEEDTSSQDSETQDDEESDQEDTEGEEDGSQEGDESNEEGEGEEESDDEGEEGDSEKSGKLGKGLFFDPNTLPEELKPAWKKMQGAFTKKMQEAAKVRNRADAFTELMSMPQFRALVDKLRNGETEEEPEEKEPARKGQRTIEEIVERAVNKAVRPIVQSSQNSKKEAQLRDEFNQFQKDHPEWENYREPMKEILEKNPSYSYEDAFKLAAFDDLLDNEGKLAGETIRSKKKANLSKGGGPSIGGKPSPKVSKTIREAFEAAEREHGVGGRKKRR